MTELIETRSGVTIIHDDIKFVFKYVEGDNTVQYSSAWTALGGPNSERTAMYDVDPMDNETPVPTEVIQTLKNNGYTVRHA